MEILKKMFLAGVGAVTLSKEKTKKIVEELVAQGQLKEKESKQLMKEMMGRADQIRKDVGKTVGAQMANAYTKVNLATQEQIKRMEKRLQQLEQELEKKKGSAVFGKKSATVRKRKKAG